MSGSAGDLTFKTLNGQTVVSEKVVRMTNPRSVAQMRVRTRWSNVIAMYSGIRPLLNNGFENRPLGLSDYNMFVKVNMQRTPIYLTKQALAGGACIATAYQITQGSLPAIVVTGSGQGGSTDIRLTGLTISNSTTVAEFSQAVVNNNADYRYGDQISFFLVKQLVNAATEIPYCQFSAAKVILDAANTETLASVTGGSTGFKAVDGKLGHNGNDGDCAYTWVHSRKSVGRTLVSTHTPASPSVAPLSPLRSSSLPTRLRLSIRVMQPTLSQAPATVIQPALSSPQILMQAVQPLAVKAVAVTKVVEAAVSKPSAIENGKLFAEAHQAKASDN